MIRNLDQFVGDLRRFNADTQPEEVTTIVRRLTLEALRRIVLRTPVKTGRAQNSWQTTIGAPTNDDVRLADPISAGEAVLQALPHFEAAHVGSNVPYILPLENGHSQRSADGMVAVTVEELRNVRIGDLLSNG